MSAGSSSAPYSASSVIVLPLCGGLGAEGGSVPPPARGTPALLLTLYHRPWEDRLPSHGSLPGGRPVSVTSRPLFVPAGGGRQADFSPSQRRLLAGARGLAHLFDDKFGVLGFRFGLDTIVGLVPGIGDLISSGASAYLLLVGIQ